MIISSLQSSNMEVGELIEGYSDFFEDQYEDKLEDFHQWEDTRNFNVLLSDLEEYDEDLSEGLQENPDKHYYNAQIGLEELADDYDQISGAVLRFKDFPESVPIRDIRAEHVNKFVSFDGVVSKRTSVQPKLRKAKVKCSKCGNTMVVDQLAEEDLKLPPNCATDDCSGTPTHFRVLHAQSELVDFQKLLLQESPDKLRGGEKPQRVAVHLEGDLTGKITAGEKVTINGVVRTKRENKTAVFDSYVNGNSIEQEQDDFEEIEIGPDDEEKIKELASSDDIYEKLASSIEPSITGYETVKNAVGLQLFSGVRKPSVDGGSKIRGDFHILLVGDPGTGKSRILQFAKSAMPSAGVYASGKSTSSAGLCVGGDTVIQYNNELVKIKDVVDEHVPDTVENPTAIKQTFDTVAFDGSDTKEHQGSDIWKMPRQTAVTFNTQQGRELTVSPQTPLLVATQNGVEWVEAGEISEGDHIASPTEIQNSTTSPRPINYFDFNDENIGLSQESRELIKTQLSNKYGTLREAASGLNFSESFIYETVTNQKIPYEKLNRILETIDAEISDLEITEVELRNGVSIEIPNEFTSDLLWLVGLIFADGSISVDEKNHTVRISNSDEIVLQNAIRVFRDAFNKNPSIEFPEDDVRPPEICVKSKTIVNFLRNSGMDSPPKKNLKLDGRLALSQYRTGFLQGFFDSDSSFNTRKEANGGTSISVSSISEPLINQVQLLLLYEGINSRTRKRAKSGTVTKLSDGQEIHSKHDQFELSIEGRDVPRYVEEIGLSSQRKLKPDQHLYRESSHSIDTVNQNSMIKLGTKSVHSEDAEQNLRWNLVTDVSVSEQELYDLTTVQSNFIANGIVVHNTASAVKDDFSDTNQWTLKAGAMVVADKGVACIDEIDKMNNQDRSAMHESLEQQTVSVAKAGINTTLKSRCSLLAAANPKEGRFQDHIQISEQINMEPALISRFDLIFIIKDIPDEDEDSNIAEHILTTSRRGEKVVSNETLDEQESEKEPDIPLDLLRKYVAYARKNCTPVLTEEAHSRIKDFYVHLRNNEGVDDVDSVPVTARKLEGLVRIAEANAKVRLSEEVTLEDAERAIDLVLASLEEVGIDPETGELDADVLESGTSATQRDKVSTIKEVISDLEDENNGKPVKMVEIVDECKNRGLSEDTDFEHYISKLARTGDIYEPDNNEFKTVD